MKIWATEDPSDGRYLVAQGDDDMFNDVFDNVVKRYQGNGYTVTARNCSKVIVCRENQVVVLEKKR